MRTHKTILFMVIAGVLLACSLPCSGREKAKENIWCEEKPEREHKLLQHKRAERAKLRSRPKLRSSRSEKRRRMAGKIDPEFIKWLKGNYPEESEKLARMKSKPELHRKRAGLSLKKYRRIYEASKRNPQLAENLKKDLELKGERDKLLREIKSATDKQKKQLTRQLEEVVGQRFDLIVEQRQIRYEQLLKKLEKLKERVEQSEAEVVKWQDAGFKKDNVRTRIEELVGKAEMFKWD